MGKVNPLDFTFHIKKGDTNLPLRMRLYNGDACTDLDITGYSIKFYMAPVDDRTSLKIDGASGEIVSGSEGIFQYQWQAGDTDTEGKFEFVFKLTIGSNTFSVPLVSPGIVIIEQTLGS